MDWVQEAGFTHCFFVAGGNAMHLIESASSRFECIPFINEVGAGIAAESFNEICSRNERAFVLVTAGPGLTNLTTAVASAWVDRRELFVIGGQAKSINLSRGSVRQVGFQEIDGVGILAGITKRSVLVDHQIDKSELWSHIQEGRTSPKGPVFVEVCLDISMQETKESSLQLKGTENLETAEIDPSDDLLELVCAQLTQSERPLVLIGGEIDRYLCANWIKTLEKLGVPIATTFNGADRISSDYKYYSGRPNWYGSRWANLIIQQSDYVLALGARLGLMETGYNWEEFVPRGRITQVELDPLELEKGHPNVHTRIQADPNLFLEGISSKLLGKRELSISDWQNHIVSIKNDLEKPEKANIAKPGYVEFSKFIYDLTSLLSAEDIINPCSSGGNFEAFGKLMVNKAGQKWVTSPGLASMGFGISGGIGMSLAFPDKRTIVFEGDGGLAQNLQEFGVIRSNNLNLKVFIADNGNYGSIKAHQKSAFNNHYIGCDKATGLWLPNWKLIGDAFGIPVHEIESNDFDSDDFKKVFNAHGPAIFILKIDPDQVLYPKIASSRNAQGEVVSNPLHLMEPPLSESDFQKYCRFLL